MVTSDGGYTTFTCFMSPQKSCAIKKLQSRQSTFKVPESWSRVQSLFHFPLLSVSPQLEQSNTSQLGQALSAYQVVCLTSPQADFQILVWVENSEKPQVWQQCVTDHVSPGRSCFCLELLTHFVHVTPCVRGCDRFGDSSCQWTQHEPRQAALLISHRAAVHLLWQIKSGY